MNRLFALTVGRNEADRYLSAMLDYHSKIVDGHFFYDDQSTDGTAQLARDHGCTVVERPGGIPSFDQDEGAFREAAWHAMEEAFLPQPGDWVFVVDCDEALVSINGEGVRETLQGASDRFPTCTAINVNVPEVFGFDEDGTPLVRMDRLWGTIHGVRFVPYRPGGTFLHGDLGVPSIPQYGVGDRWASWAEAPELRLMHFGYADHRDHQWKYDRYAGRVGHSNEHVASIIAADKQLVRWPHAYPEGMRTTQ